MSSPFVLCNCFLSVILFFSFAHSYIISSITIKYKISWTKFYGLKYSFQIPINIWFQVIISIY